MLWLLSARLHKNSCHLDLIGGMALRVDEVSEQDLGGLSCDLLDGLLTLLVLMPGFPRGRVGCPRRHGGALAEGTGESWLLAVLGF